jgi:hypothetical protein
MHDKWLAGHAILIVEPELGRFACDLQGALEAAGAESLIARNAEAAVERLSRFTFSAGIINCGGHQQEIGALVGRLRSASLVLYGEGAAAFAAQSPAQRLTVAAASVTSILAALERSLDRSIAG